MNSVMDDPAWVRVQSMQAEGLRRAAEWTERNAWNYPAHFTADTKRDLQAAHTALTNALRLTEPMQEAAE